MFVMRSWLSIVAKVVGTTMLAVTLASAEATFTCKAAPNEECAFTVWTIDANGKDTGSTNFVLDAGMSHGLNDQWKGGRYCVNSGPKRQQTPIRPDCLAQMNKNGKKGVVSDKNE